MTSFGENRAISAHKCIAALCIALVMIATSVAAWHACEAYSRGKAIGNASVVTPDHASCLICASAHSPGMAAYAAPLSFALIVSEVAPEMAATEPQGLEDFALHIRPPPAL